MARNISKHAHIYQTKIWQSGTIVKTARYRNPLLRVIILSKLSSHLLMTLYPFFLRTSISHFDHVRSRRHIYPRGMLFWWQWHQTSFRPTAFLSCLTPSFYWWHFSPHRHPGSHAGWPFSHQIRRDVVKWWTPSWCCCHCWKIRTMVRVWFGGIRITNWGRSNLISALSSNSD